MYSTNCLNNTKILVVSYHAFVIVCQVEFDAYVNAESISIYETFHAGAVVKVSLRDPSGNWVPVWTGDAQNIEESRVFQPPLAVNRELSVSSLLLKSMECIHFISYNGFPVSNVINTIISEALISISRIAYGIHISCIQH